MPYRVMDNEYTVEPDGDGTFMVVQHGTYGMTSVLAGESCRSRVGYYTTVEKALEAYPKAEVMQGVGYDTLSAELGSNMSDVAPSWFDPTLCGETWDDSEDDLSGIY